MQPLIHQSQVSGEHLRVKVRASRLIKAKIKVKARAKASLRIRASPMSHLPHGKETEKVSAKSPSKDREAAQSRHKAP